MQRHYKTNIQQKRDQIKLLLALHADDHVEICDLIRQGYWLDFLDPYKYIGPLSIEHFEHYTVLKGHIDLIKIVRARDNYRLSYNWSNDLYDVTFKFA